MSDQAHLAWPFPGQAFGPVYDNGSNVRLLIRRSSHLIFNCFLQRGWAQANNRWSAITPTVEGWHVRICFDCPQTVFTPCPKFSLRFLNGNITCQPIPPTAGQPTPPSFEWTVDVGTNLKTFVAY